MRFARSLAFKLLAVVLLPTAIQVYVFTGPFFAFTAAQRAVLDVGLVAGELAFFLLVAAAALVLGGRVQRGLGTSDPDVRRRAASAAIALPKRLAALLLVGGSLLDAAVAAAVQRQDLPADLLAAGVAAATAFCIMQAMLCYGVAAVSTSRVAAELGSADAREEESVRTKVLVLSCGLLAIATLLFGGVTYARHRADTDREYVEEAVAAQARAAALLDARGAAFAAELVHLVSGAPTVVLGPAGEVLTRAGGELPGRAPDRARAPAVLAAADGWWVARGAGAAEIVSFLPDAPLERRRAAFLADTSALGVLLFCAAALLVGLSARGLTAPLRELGRAADRIAAGDLTTAPPTVSNDEIGRLAADFRRMAHGLSALVNDVQAASRGVEQGAAELGAIGARVRGGAREEHERVVAAGGAVEAMQGSVALVASGVDGLSDYVRTTSAAVGEMMAALEEVRRHAADLDRRAQAAGRDIEALAAAGGRAGAELSELDRLASTAHAALAAASGTLVGLETSAVAGQGAAAEAAQTSEEAGAAVEQTAAGMDALRAAVDDAKRRVTALGRRSDDIDQILDFIGEVAGRTNLLSLNASIIATQAGEHGKAFAVVADQIRELAAQISSSTKSIARIIGALRDDVDGTARLIERGDALAATGVAQARRSLSALAALRGATVRGNEAAVAIRGALQAHAQSTRDVSNLVSGVADGTRGLSDALQLVGRSVAAAESVSRGVSAVADQVTRALEEQSGVGRRQAESLERIDAMLADIARAVASHQAATLRARDVLGQLTRAAELQEAAVVELAGVAEGLGGRSRALAQSVGRFKI